MDNNALIQAMVGLHFKGGADITPDDLGTHNYNGIVCNNNGNVRVDFVDGTTATLRVGRGDVLDVHITRVYVTGTNVVGIIGLNPRDE